MNKFLYFFCLFVFTSFTSFAQKDKASGYLKLNNGDELKGYVTVLNDIESEIRVKFHHKIDGRAKNYKAKDIKSYGFEATHVDEVGNEYKYWRHYKQMTMHRPARVMATPVSLVEHVCDGYITSYVFKYDTPSDFDMPERTLYIIRREGMKEKRIEIDDFKKEARKLFHDYTALVNQLGNKKFKFANMKRMIDDYNYWKENQHSPDEYKLNPKIFMDMID